LADEAKERLSGSMGKELLKQRKVRVEGVFALGKDLHGLRRTRFMGRWRVQIQLWLTAAVINIKRAIKQLIRIDLATESNEVTRRAYIAGLFFNVANKIPSVFHRFSFYI
jgi:hypothetical protein